MERVKNRRNTYGYFSEDGKEFIITKPLTPRPWINVISNKHNYGLTISQAGGGYSWYRHAKENRLTRWDQDIIRDEWGKFIYMRDNKSRCIYSFTYQPVRKAPKKFSCHHGLGYTTFMGMQADIASELSVFVPPDDTLEIWCLELTNESRRVKDLSLFTYFELNLGVAPDWHREFHKLFIETSYDARKKALYATKRLWTLPDPDGAPWNRSWEYIAFHAASQKPASFEADKESFLGNYGSLDKPRAVIEGRCSNTEGKWNDSIGSLHIEVKLKPKEAKKIVFLLGVAKDRKEADRLISKYNNIKAATSALSDAKKLWLDLFDGLHIKTPDKDFDAMNNYWLRYQSISGRIWGRSAYYQMGGDYGYRDQLQDSQIFLTIDPRRTKEQILLNASHQFRDGMVQHWWDPLNNMGIKNNITDNLLWLPFLTIQYLKETTDFDILKEKIDYVDSNRRTSLYDHWHIFYTAYLLTGQSFLSALTRKK